MEENIISSIITSEDHSLDNKLRPKMLKDFVGQEKIKDNLSVIIQAAIGRGEHIDHVVLSGPPGLGKTTLAGIIANESGVQMKSCTGPAISRTGDLAAVLTNLEPGQVLFIDEIHRLSKQIEEVLYQAMEDYRIDIILGKGPGARSLKLELPPFTLIGATTRLGLLSSPLRDRFGLDVRIDYYPASDLDHLILRSSKILNIKIDKDALAEIARRSRGTPRIANRLLKRARDYVEVKHQGHITPKFASDALNFFEVDQEGLGLIDNKILRVLVKDFEGKPIGLNTLAAAIGEEKDGLEEVYEPFLIQQGFIHKTTRGRVATAKAFNHLNVEIQSKKALF